MTNLTGLQFEAVVDGAIYTRNVGIFYTIPEKEYMLVCIPKLGTPICTEEIQELEELDPKGVYICSVDSPEVAEQAFDELLVDLPFLRINPTMREFSSYINEDGYTNRVTIYVRDGKIIGNYLVADDEKRDIPKMLNVFIN